MFFDKHKVFLLYFLLFSLFLVPQVNGQLKNEYKEKYRPQYHFSPVKNWMNDPNGLVYYKNEYHLFYQYNPFGNDWGHMSWGHAVSKDLVHWKHLPVAIPEKNGVMAFSGSAVVDWKNTSGFGKKGEPPLVAIYTGFRSSDGMQFQCIAYSNDRGRTWMPYENNPVININSKSFRDPKVFWYSPDNKWVMIAALSDEHKVRLYESKDLKEWAIMSEFGGTDTANGAWECPDFFPLKLDDNSENVKWIVTINTDGGSHGSMGTKYYTGRFDGKKFIEDSPLNAETNRVDMGKDFYAVQSYSDIPKTDGRRIWIGWMYNSSYEQFIPTYPWKNFQSIPRSLSLKTFPDGVKLVQTPVAELKNLRAKSYNFENITLNRRDSLFSNEKMNGNTLEVEAEIEPGSASSFGIEVRKGNAQKTVIGYDAVKQVVYIDRSESGENKLNDKFNELQEAPLPLSSGIVKLHIFVDCSSVEVIAGDGQVVMSDLIFPSPESSGFDVFTSGGDIKIKKLQVWNLKSIWN